MPSESDNSGILRSSEKTRRDLLARLLTAQEDERRRISRELHDTIGQHLTALALGLKTLEASVGSESGRQTLRQLQQLTERAGKEIHDIALELRPTALDDLGLARTLANFLDEWSAAKRIHVDLHCADLSGMRLSPDVEIAVYRIIQEALHNVFRHAAADRVSVVLQRKNERLCAIIEDNGRGFDPDGEVREGDRPLGILGMHERAAMVAGSLRVESTPGTGTAVFVDVPLATHRDSLSHEEV